MCCWSGRNLPPWPGSSVPANLLLETRCDGDQRRLQCGWLSWLAWTVAIHECTIPDRFRHSDDDCDADGQREPSSHLLRPRRRQRYRARPDHRDGGRRHKLAATQLRLPVKLDAGLCSLRPTGCVTLSGDRRRRRMHRSPAVCLHSPIRGERRNPVLRLRPRPASCIGVLREKSKHSDRGKSNCRDACEQKRALLKSAA